MQSYGSAGEVFPPAFEVEDIAPTGAGDCFRGARSALWQGSTQPREAVTLAVAAGALARTKRGPMQAASTLETFRTFGSQDPQDRS